MVFSSIVFLFLFLPLVLFLYYICPKKFRNVVLLIFSLIFYGWGEPLYLVIMIGSIVANFIFGAVVGKYRDIDRTKAKIFVALSVVFNLGVLGFFKYANFFIENVSNAFGIEPNLLAVALPIGISFYTFQSMSYAIDIYRHDVDVNKSIVNFATYVSLFPQLIAGPIIRYKTIAQQLSTRVESMSMFSSGVVRFTIGLAKKVLLANAFGQLWEMYSALPAGERSLLGAWLGIIGFTLQIYFDFGGYSDMAIGLGRMFGFEFQINFLYPYTSKNISEFWGKRWHISLGTWFKEYLYIPLGGNRRSIPRNYLNIFIVWLLTGFWHGANWNFLIWGVYYAIILIIEKAFLLKWLNRAPRWLTSLYVMFFVIISWVIFACVDLNHGTAYFGNMFGAGNGALINDFTLYQLSGWWPMLIIGIIACTPLAANIWNKIKAKNERVIGVLKPVFVALGLIACTAYIVSATYNPFLYFRF